MRRWLLWWMALTAMAADDDVLAVGPFVDTETCYGSIIQSDANGDGKVDANEYVTFVQLSEPSGFFSDVQSFSDLPLVLQGSFNTLACYCRNQGGDDSCCLGSNAGISTAGAAPGDSPTSEQVAYLYTVCKLTTQAIDVALASANPSPAPTLAPTTGMTTFVPSPVPTFIGTTPQPSTVTGAPSISPSISTTTLRPTTAIPTVVPTTNATTLPPTTVTPTVVPTANATTLPPTTVAPTATATANATTLPPTTVAPTVAPSANVTSFTPTPSIAPSVAAVPTTGPTTPVSTPSPSRSAAPVPTAPPTLVEVVRTTYLIQVENGNSVALTTSETDDLASAMDILAPQVADATFPSRRLRRRLSVSVTNTTVDGTLPGDCPTGTPASDSCQDVQASIPLLIEDESGDTETIKDQFKQALDDAINAGDLERALQQVNDATRISVLSAVGPTPTQAPLGGDGLSGGATAGIAVAATIGVLAAIGFLVVRRRNETKDDDPYFTAGTQALATQDSASTVKTGQPILGASQADYGKKSKSSVKAFESLEEEGEIEAPVGVGANESADSSSNAGSSGWSSSAGVSSLNTGSADSNDFAAQDAAAAGATLAAIGAASAITRTVDEKNEERASVPNLPNVSRADLDSAIEAGDWAAVGATAALLAAASDSQSYSSRSRKSGTSQSRGSTISSIDAARAAELDHLVDAGDWEGVVLAAAKFEASEDTSKSSKSQSGNSLTNESSTRSNTGSTGAASHSASTISESPSKAKKRAEMRAEVEALVRRVVPEEIDNVDEMMLQFKGREEELVETLRTMQERAVAQKARVQGQKSAKREARMTIKQGGTSLPVPGASADVPVPAPAPASPEAVTELSPAAAAGVTAGVAAALGVAAGIASASRKRTESEKGSPDSKSSPSTIDETTSGSGMRRRTALELAIEAGDWEAVGEAAAMMSDTSVTTASSGEIHALAEGASYDDDSLSAKKKSGVNAERAAELDDMIDKGDWTGVVAAASRFSKTDVQAAAEETEGSQPSSSESSKKRRGWFGGKKDDKKPGTKSSDSDSTSLDKDKALKEEQDALAQAEIWMAIAQQSKQEGSTDVGASDAADWAIARSLSALRRAEARGELSQTASKDAGAPSSSDSVGEASSKGDRSV